MTDNQAMSLIVNGLASTLLIIALILFLKKDKS